MALSRIKLFRGDTLDKIVESFIGWTDLAGGSGEQAIYEGDPVNINNNAFKTLPVTTLDSGADLLDRSNPSAPTFLEAGTYAINFSVTGDALTAGGYAFALIQTGAGVVNASGQGPHPETGFSTAVTAVVEAGDALGLYVQNKDGVATRSFRLLALTLVKL